MGTDITLHLEYRKRNKKHYSYGGELEGQRLYGMFNVMANPIEYDLQSVFSLRGLPGNVTNQTYNEYKKWDYDAHHTSWLSTIELAACIVEANIRFFEEGGLGWTKPYEEILEYMLEYEKAGCECRVVFWFDQ